MWSANAGHTIHDDLPVLQCFANSVPSLSGRPTEFVVDACRSAYALHAAELDARASVASASTRRAWCLLQDNYDGVESASTECADSALGSRHDEPPEATTLTWSDSDADDDERTGDAQSSSAGRGAACCMLVYDTGNAGALLKRYLSHPRFRVTESCPGQRPAILWAMSTRYTSSHAVQWRHSFHGEEWLTEKDWLARLVQLAAGRVSWSPESFTICHPSTETGSMRNQLQEFVGAFISHDESSSRDANVWIVKPARLSRSRGIAIADDLASLLEVCTQAVIEKNPAVVSRYVVQPALYQGRKFDLRFVVALRTVQPLLLSIYDGWLVRAADEKYSLGDYANVRKHLTVMQYLDERMGAPVRKEWVRKDQLVESLVSSFGPAADEQHVRAVCHTTILECFSLVTSGISGAANELVGIDPNAPHNRVRGVYGVDVMLRPRTTCSRSQDCPLEAVILEVNYKPDLRRILREDASFFDNLFPVLFDEVRDQATGKRSTAIPNWTSYYEHTQLD